MEGRGSSSHARLLTFSDLVWAALALVLFTPLTVVSEDKEDELPRFIEDVPNITVTVGRDALLPCTVEQLKGFKVAWVQVDTQTILTIHKQVITRNPRIALLHNDHRSWHLELKNVREKDRGWYMCQVNTDPMRSKQGYVDVVVPPDIIDRESSGDLTIREGQDVTLTCRAKGHPTPSIVWRREDNQDIVLDADEADVGDLAIAATGESGGAGGGDSPHTVKSVDGETLVMKRVSRLQMGSYLCIASNGIPPSISKRTQLRVQFPPVAWVPQQLEGAYVGQELTIECHTEAFPKSINFWTNTNGDMVVADERYEPIVAETSYKVYMKLRIRRVEKRDIGTFHCIAKNSLGETDGAIRIYEIEPPKSENNGIIEIMETDGNSGEGSTLAPHTHLNKELKKYEDGRHPKGINDVTDGYQRPKNYDGTGPGHHTKQQRGLPQSSYGHSFGQNSATSLATPSAFLALVFACAATILTSALLRPGVPHSLFLRSCGGIC